MARYRKYIDKRGKLVVERNQFGRIERFFIPEDEYNWAVNLKQIMKLVAWHRYNGLQRAYPHPMGKDLAELYDKYLNRFLGMYPTSSATNPYREIGSNHYKAYIEIKGNGG